MAYSVIITPSAKADIFETNTWLLEHYPEYADAWLWSTSEAITSLTKFPERCAVCFESRAFDDEVRQLLYGKKSNVNRIHFAIQENEVYILRVRSTRQRSLIDQIKDDD